MTEPANPLATGGMSPEGTTTVVRIAKPKVSLSDRLVLCPAICKCKDSPDTGADGRSLKQACVSRALSKVDKAMDHQSPYKPEVNYDMTKEPPEPIMDSEIATKAHDWLPGWINKYWEADHGYPYLKGAGMVRRPDVVVVDDPSKPPTQDNIKQIVEIKFPPDQMSKEQQTAYTTIAGSENKLAVIGPDDCTCDQPRPDPSKVPTLDPQQKTAAVLILTTLAAILAL